MALRALVIDQPWIELILSGQKSWEMRSTSTSIRGPIALIEKGSGTVVGTAILEDSRDPLTPLEMATWRHAHQIPAQLSEAAGFKWFTPWVLSDVVRLSEPVGYRHPSGAVIWVTLDAAVETAVRSDCGMAVTRRFARVDDAAARSIAPNASKPRVASGRSGPSISIPLTGGNIRNGHFYLRGALDTLPADSIGGANKAASGRPVTLTFVPGETIDTDVDGTKMIFRSRSSVSRFFELSGACEGDTVLLEQTGQRQFRIQLAKS